MQKERKRTWPIFSNLDLIVNNPYLGLELFEPLHKSSFCGMTVTSKGWVSTPSEGFPHHYINLPREFTPLYMYLAGGMIAGFWIERYGLEP